MEIILQMLRFLPFSILKGCRKAQWLRAGSGARQFVSDLLSSNHKLCSTSTTPMFQGTITPFYLGNLNYNPTQSFGQQFQPVSCFAQTITTFAPSQLPLSPFKYLPPEADANSQPGVLGVLQAGRIHACTVTKTLTTYSRWYDDRYYQGEAQGRSVPDPRSTGLESKNLGKARSTDTALTPNSSFHYHEFISSNDSLENVY